MLSLATVTLLTVSAAFAHPHFGGYPRFYDEERSVENPTVNVFKIYAPRLFYMPGYENPAMENRFTKSKQMISSGEHMFDEIMRTESFPNSLFDEEANSVFDYEDDFVPQPSNIVSRKMPRFAPNMMAPGRSVHFDDFDSNAQNFIDDEPRYVPEYYDMHDGDCEHHGIFPAYNPQMNDDYPNFPDVPYFNPIYMNDLPHGPIEGPQFPIFSPGPVGPLTTFFKKIVSEPINNDKVHSQVLTTITFGEPEIIENEKKAVAQQLEKFNSKQRQDGFTIIMTEELPLTNEEDTTVEVERNFIKTILPDNTSVTSEIEGQESNENYQEEDIEDEVEVNIVKTVLPDNSYLISEAGGDDEKMQDEVITMIQNADNTKAEDGSKGSMFISRYLQTPQ